MRLTGLWWWIDRWRKSSAYMDMTLEQQGAYRNLLDEAALRGGPLPNDERILAKACGDALRWRKVGAVVMAKFTLSADGWHNDTLDAVIEESARRAKKQRDWRNKKGNASGNKSGNAVSNTAGNDTRPPDPDPDREHIEPPNPLSAKGGRVRILRKDRQEAERILNLHFGRCTHKPRHDDPAVCRAEIAAALAERRRDAEQQVTS